MGFKRIQYKGESEDLRSHPWLRLVHGRHYLLDIHETRSGKVRVNVKDGEDGEPMRIFYKDREALERKWCV